MARAGVTTTRTASWGITGASSDAKAYGVVVELDINTQLSSQDELNEVGSVIGKVQYDERYSGSITVQCRADVAAPTAGSWITCNPFGKLLCTSARIVESNQNYRRMTIQVEGSRYVKNQNNVEVV